MVKLRTIMLGTMFSAMLIVGYEMIRPTEAHAGLWNTLTTGDWDKIQPTKYVLDVKGFDLRAYEWVPATSPGTTCVAMFGETGPTGLDCFDTAK